MMPAQPLPKQKANDPRPYRPLPVRLPAGDTCN
jgi:hypothetical protein